ncbi:ABC transporter substrate-binding protein [Halomarina litorea]|uniref:ABC transporter substrate-binding protein n=1 Tax=Halomarina litorea TaxID=2961595 RepID=UPI0020C20FD1|nr:ABC transporter substrate-binding protein [Halomarina sp. BCD28]
MTRSSRRTFLKGTGTASIGALTALAGCAGDGGNGDGGGGGDGGDSGGGGNGSGGGGGGGGGTQSLKIGHLVPLSGPFATIGEPSQKGADLAVKQVNDAGEGVELEVVHKDTESSPDTGVQRARELVQQEEVDVLLGFASSSVAKAVSEFAASQDVLAVATIAQTPTITGSECKPQTFRTASNLDQLTTGLAQTTASLTDGSAIAGVIPDYSFGKETWAVFQEEMSAQADASVVAETFPAFGKGDFQNEIQAVLDAGPDIVYTSLWAGDLITFIKQAQQYDFFEQVPEFVAGSGAITDVSRSLGSDMVEMIAVDRYFFQYPDTERNTAFVEAWREEYDEIPLNVGQETYAGVYALMNAITESGGTSTDDLVSGLEGLEFQAPEGTKRIRAADHQVIDENIWTGRIGPVDDLEFYGFTEMNPVPGESVTPEPNCEM